MVDKIQIIVKPVVTVSPKISVTFPIKTTVIVRLLDRLLKVIRKGGNA